MIFLNATKQDLSEKIRPERPILPEFFPAQCGEIQLPEPLKGNLFTPKVIGGSEVVKGSHPWQVCRPTFFFKFIILLT